MNSGGNSWLTHASPTAGSCHEPTAGEPSRSYGPFRFERMSDAACKGRELTESQDQQREGEQQALRARAQHAFCGRRAGFRLRRCGSGCTSLSRAMEINTCAVGALSGAASVPHAMESRLSSAACRLRALPGLGRSSATGACSGSCLAPPGSASWPDPPDPPRPPGSTKRALSLSSSRVGLAGVAGVAGVKHELRGEGPAHPPPRVPQVPHGNARTRLARNCELSARAP